MIFVQISSLIKAIPKIIVPKATNCMSSESNVQTCLSITESRWQKAKANWSAFLCCNPSKWTIFFDNLTHFAMLTSILEQETPCKCLF